MPVVAGDLMRRQLPPAIWQIVRGLHRPAVRGRTLRALRTLRVPRGVRWLPRAGPRVDRGPAGAGRLLRLRADGRCARWSSPAGARGLYGDDAEPGLSWSDRGPCPAGRWSRASCAGVVSEPASRSSPSRASAAIPAVTAEVMAEVRREPPGGLLQDGYRSFLRKQEVRGRIRAPQFRRERNRDESTELTQRLGRETCRNVEDLALRRRTAPACWARWPSRSWPRPSHRHRCPLRCGTTETSRWSASRVAVWVAAQVHLLFAAFVLGVPMFAVVAEAIGIFGGDEKLRQAVQGIHPASPGRVFRDGDLGRRSCSFLLITIYPRPSSATWRRCSEYSMWVYVGTLLPRVLHALPLLLRLGPLEEGSRQAGSTGGWASLLNVWGTIVMLIANGWLTYMMSPPADVGPDTAPQMVQLWTALDQRHLDADQHPPDHRQRGLRGGGRGRLRRLPLPGGQRPTRNAPTTTGWATSAT